MPQISLNEYAEQYVKTMIEMADKLGPDTVMGQACLNRAEIVMDFIEAYREYLKRPS